VRRGLLLGLLAALACAAPASAHSVMKVEGNTIFYSANDDVSLNDLQVTVQGNELRFLDRGAQGGITPASECSPGGQTDSEGNPVEILCPRTGITTIRIDVGDAQDKVTAQLPLAILVLGGRGADTVTTGEGNDVVNGGEANDTARTAGGNDQLVGDVGDDQLSGEGGDDTIQGALGADTVDGGAGNDTIRVRDGAADRGTCGDGNDTAQADGADALDACEAVDRPEGEPIPPPTDGGGPAPPDTTAPRLRAGGSTFQRAGRTGRVTVLATVSEVAEVAGGGYVTIGERRFAFRSTRAAVGVGGAGIRLRLTLEPRDARRLWRMLRGRRRAVARVTIVATDAAGNSAAARLPRIALRR
jgi:RTX calcium-binding nonapeptide repeat (4 copies)